MISIGGSQVLGERGVVRENPPLAKIRRTFKGNHTRADFVCVAYEKPLIRHFVSPSPHALRLRGEGKLVSRVR